jgi:peptidoglycan hydrolase-like protein with peptidoglycan-binding domain
MVMTILSQMTLLALILCITPALADELTLTVEQHLARLGYDTGEADGEETVETMIAIAKYQAENGYAITGEASEKLSGALAKTTSVGNAPKVRALKPDKRAAVVVSDEGLSAAREACLKDKMMISQSTGPNNNVTNEIKGQLIDQAAQAAIQATGIGMAQQVYTLYSQWKSKSESDTPKQSEMAAIASSLGISEDDVAACQRPAD